jgi:HAD superfamily hydrolase (TIGR01459 family)
MPERPPESYLPLLEAAAARRLPLLCANPDVAGLTAAGLIPGPGLLAQHYEALGGSVRWFGKPHPEVYALCRPALGAAPAGRTIAIGDSLAHDIAGGQGMGFATAFVAGGIHGGGLSPRLDAAPDRPRLEALFAEHGVVPDWVVPAFRW